MRRHFMVLLSIATLAACTGGDTRSAPTAPTPEPTSPVLETRDGSRGAGAAGFFWLPPIVTTPPIATGTFDNTVLGALEVELCELATSACAPGAFQRRFTSAGTSLTNRLRLFTNLQYQVMYASASDNLDPAKHYRITVRAFGVALGFADIDVVNTLTALPAVDRTRFVGLLRGQNLPISFRVDDVFPMTCNATSLDALASQVFGAGAPSAAFRNAVRRMAYLNRFATVTETDAALAALLAELSAQESAAAGDATRLARIAQLRAALYCVLGRPLPVPAATVSGTVTGTNGRGALSGVSVRVDPSGLTGLTDAVGRYSIPNVPVGTATLTITNGLPTDCSAPAAIEVPVTVGGATVDFEVTCDPPAVAIVPVTLTAGESHACGLTADGAAYCWGNTALALGNGSIAGGSEVPVPVSGGLNFSTLSAGSRHTCGVTTGGVAYCWGAGGVIGDGTQDQRSVPARVSGDLHFTAIAAGESHTCGLTSTGAAYCWGVAFNGRLGDGTMSGVRLTPVPVVGGHKFKSITVSRQNVSGQGHTCGVTTIGEVLCWGNNTWLQLGVIAPTESAIPLKVSLASTIESVAAGTLHTCALDSVGNAYCWGARFAYTADGGAALPRQPAPGLTFGRLAVGTYHTCGLTTTGAAYCFGLNSVGEFGDGTSSAEGGVPRPPTIVAGGRQFSVLTAGFNFTCGVAEAGRAFCWGTSGGGQLGDGSRGRRIAPAQVLGGITFSSIAAGGEHTCALTETGTSFCWGASGTAAGRLGDGVGRMNRHAPERVVGGVSFSEIDGSPSALGEIARNAFSCGLTTAGVTYCWGGNANQQLGIPGGDRLAPARVEAAPTFTQLALGASHACGRTDAGTTYCWGGNFFGMLGRGPVGGSNQVVPAPITGTFTFTSIASGAYHSCGLTETGAAYCWGRNNRGQLGDGTSGTDRGAPVPVSGGLAFVALVGGAEHTCGIATNGAAYCWGYNAFGQLGNASVPRFTSALTPVLVDGGHTFASLGTGDSHTCGVTASGSGYCWGWNQNGQLGDGSTESSRGSPAPVAGGLQFTAIVGGRDHSCGLTTTGSAWCWGWTDQGRVGDEFIRAVAGGLTFRGP